MGLMLEQVTPALSAAGGVHARAPSKAANIRLEQLDMAGRLKIPFTTGLLCGVGETRADRLESLRAIPAGVPRADGDEARFDVAEDLPALVSAARKLLPSDVSIQVPPNLAQIDLLQKCLEAGADDVGGLSATDHVNPTYAFPDVQTDLAEAVRHLGRDLRRRAPVHDRFVDWM
eukprot:CAMPEP_0184131368 /NCGR_PEP_ID=MMETSP0974-20121125/28081_1 /TAXON_ID=483370 /ORGANISM="non described non described, Strain CCMP2097" /LENGTH=173 /DNA_ID=CAMNT_0026434863 /DNA_START=1 /DNA_END=520 /DNA_ORIENTATION=-